jgi:hypothetical protein
VALRRQGSHAASRACLWERGHGKECKAPTVPYPYRWDCVNIHIQKIIVYLLYIYGYNI